MRKIIFSLCAMGLLSWGTLLAQSGAQSAQNPSSQDQQGQTPPQGRAEPQSQAEQQPAATNAKAKKDHLKKMSGKLVDAPCMEKGLSSMQGGQHSQPSQAAPAQAPRGEGFEGDRGEPQAGAQQPAGPGQAPGGPGRQTMPGDTQPNPGQAPYPGQQAPTGPSPAERAAKQCPASSSTTTFGLVLSDGKFVKLDDQGNTKASEAIKNTAMKEGKAPKAQAKGTLEGDTIRVADIRIKGEKASASSTAQRQAASPGY